ncbi:MAG: type II toxin-antitoxin system PemK/MazF family toxin [Verrucomicrobia bacterium]|nr:type II toxin-antitoxin system PemK/MazF family toxin [Verrucomicrobiota bacterium]
MRYRVILVPFPFDDLTGSKVRPAVCLTDALGAPRHVVLAFITSVVPPKMEPTDLLLDPGNADFAGTGLRVRSALRLHRMVTVSAAIIRRQLGVLGPNIQVQVQQRLRTLFAL